MKKVDVFIIGTGFCASTIFSYLTEYALTVQVLEPSSRDTLIKFTKTTDSIFSESQANSTSGLGGGSAIWGKAITHANEKNWFMSRGNESWESLHGPVMAVTLPKKMNIPKLKTGRSDFARRFLPYLTERFHEEIGQYAGHRLGPSNTFSLPEIDPSCLLFATVLDLRAHDGGYLVTVQEKDGTTSQWKCKNLVLASGTFLNACFFSLLSGQSEFPLSNHFSANFGRIHLRKPITISDGIQTYANGEKEFSTFTTLDSTQNFGERPNTSIRLQSNKHSVGKKSIFLSLLKFEYKFLFKTIIPYLICSLRGARLVDELMIRVVADQSINESNRMKVTHFKDGLFYVDINLNIEERVVLDAYAAVEEFIQLVSNSKIVKSIESYEQDKITWDDPAHYFGTTPIGLYNFPSALTSDSESTIYTGLYVTGSSSFPVGSHGHPTLLAAQLAMIVASRIVFNEKGE
jgi:hypothetical protein